MTYTLKPYQSKTVSTVGNRINESEIVETLKAFADNPGSRELMQKANKQHGVQIKAPTGAGKTIIIGSLIKEHLEKFVVLVFSPGAGNLEEQTAKKLDIITSKTETINESTFNYAPVPGKNYVSNWEALVSMRKGSNAYITKLSKDSENQNIFDWLGRLTKAKTPVAIIVDESHHGSAKASGAILSFLDDIRRTLGYSPYLIEASATPILKEGAEEGTVSIDVSDVIKEGLLRKTVRLNAGASEVIEKMTVEQRAETDLENVIFEAAFKKLQEIDKEYIRVGSDYHGLMAIQLPSSVAGKEAIERIEAFFRPHGITVQNGQLALFMNGAKEGDMEIIHTPESPVRVLLYKQGISMGWDCPRAQVLVGLRHLTSKVFTTQNLGRFIRTTEAKHYNNDVLDSAYVYSNVGDMGSKNFDKDADHTLRYEGEVNLRQDDNGRYALQSINDLNLELSVFARKNQDALDRKIIQNVWLEKATEERLWDVISYVDTNEVTDTLGEGEVSAADAIATGDDTAVMTTSSGVGVNHSIRWEQLSNEVLRVITNGRSFGNNANVLRITMPVLIRWFTETLTRAESEAKGREHWGKNSAIYEEALAALTEDGKKKFEVNAFIAELLLDDANFAPLRKVLEKVFSDKRLLPKPEVNAEGEEITTKDIRVKEILPEAYAVPKTLRVLQTPDHEVKEDYVENYAFTHTEFHGDGTSTLRAYRQEAELSGPERAFEAFINTAKPFGSDSSVCYLKNGTKQRDNFSIAVEGKDKAGNFYPDYLVEFGFVKDDKKVYLPAIFETKDANIKENLDRLVLEKAQSLIALSESKKIPAGVIFPAESGGFDIIVSVDVEANTYTTQHLNDYLVDGSKGWNVP